MNRLKLAAMLVLAGVIGAVVYYKSRDARWQRHFDAARTAINESRVAEARVELDAAEADRCEETAHLGGPWLEDGAALQRRYVGHSRGARKVGSLRLAASLWGAR